jgi:phage tail sheath gpL-like
MSTLSMALTGLDTSNPVPGIYAEVRFAQGQTAGDLGPKRVLILAPKTSAGSITVDTQIVGPLSDEADFITYAGPGSPAHRMARAFLASCKSAEVYLLCPTAATGSAAVDLITLTTTATANGVLTITFAGEDIDVPITTGDTPTVIGDAAVIAFNNRTWLPATAANSSGVVTFTGKIAGTDLNSIRFRAKITGTGVGTTVAPTADTAFGASAVGAAAIGVGTISYTSALATMLARNFDYILAGTQVAAPIDALLDQVSIQAEPSTGFRQKCIFGAALTPSAAVTLASGTSMNRPRARLVNAEECPVEHYVLCATVGASMIKEEIVDPSFNFDGYGSKPGQTLILSAPYNDSARPTMTEQKSMLNGGVTPIAYTDGGQPYVVRSVTTYCKNGSNFDYRVRDSHLVCIADKFTNDMVAKLAASPWTKVTSDPVAGAREPAPEFATPRRIKASVEQLVSDYVDAGWLDPAKRQATLDGIQVGQDPSLPSRLNTSVPLYSAVLLHQHALLVKESSAAT